MEFQKQYNLSIVRRRWFFTTIVFRIDRRENILRVSILTFILMFFQSKKKLKYSLITITDYPYITTKVKLRLNCLEVGRENLRPLSTALSQKIGKPANSIVEEWRERKNIFIDNQSIIHEENVGKENFGLLSLTEVFLLHQRQSFADERNCSLPLKFPHFRLPPRMKVFAKRI